MRAGEGRRRSNCKGIVGHQWSGQDDGRFEVCRQDNADQDPDFAMLGFSHLFVRFASGRLRSRGEVYMISIVTQTGSLASWIPKLEQEDLHEPKDCHPDGG